MHFNFFPIKKEMLFKRTAQLQMSSYKEILNLIFLAEKK